MLSELAQRFADDRNYRLLSEWQLVSVLPFLPPVFTVVDSCMNLFRQDYSGRGELSERQQASHQGCPGSASLTPGAETQSVPVKAEQDG